jgi:cytochrome P450
VTFPAAWLTCFLLVIELYSRLMLDIIGVFGLGVDLENLSSEHSVFHDCYHETFAPGPTGMALTAINAFVPIRWLPVKANRDFIRANGIVHSILGNIVKQRIAEVQEARKQPDLHNGTSGDEKSKDLLTYMVEEKYFGDGGDHWSEDDMLNQILNFVAGGE